MNEDLTPAEKRRAWWILGMSTFAFTVCFAAWMMNGVLITFLVDNDVYSWDGPQMGWLFGAPVLTGAIFRLPLGIATDVYGGRIVYGLLQSRCSWPATAVVTGSFLSLVLDSVFAEPASRLELPIRLSGSPRISKERRWVSLERAMRARH
jgi:nitrate/nitrite transporter NarK